MRLWRKCRQVPRIYGPRGIEVSPDQVKGHGNTSTQSKKELQCLTVQACRIRTLHSPRIDELRPFFLAIRKAHKDGRTPSKCFQKLSIVSCSHLS
ncbi:hypothetical protein AAG906_019014 [Vitis piasezkii]